MAERRQAPRSEFPTFLRAYGVAAAGFVVVTMAVGAMLIVREHRQAREYWSARLEAVVAARTAAVAQWWSIIIADSRLMGSDLTVQAATRGGPVGPMRDRLGRFVSDATFDAVAVYSGPGRIMTHVGAPRTGAEDAAARLAVATGQLAHTVVVAPEDSVRILLALPLSVSGSGYPVMVITVNPDQALRRLVSAGVAGTESGEVVVAARSGDEAIYLVTSESGDQVVRASLKSPSLLVAAGFAGIDSAGEYTDHRGATVLGVPDRDSASGWAIGAKIDAAEAVADARRVSGFIILVALSAGVAGVSAMAVSWARARDRHVERHTAEWRHGLERDRRQQAESRGARLAALLDDSTDAFFVIDAESLRVRMANRAARTHLQLTAEELERRTLLDFMPDSDPEQFAGKLALLRDERDAELQFEADWMRRDGSRFPASLRLHHAPHESPPVFYAVVRDVTDRHILERQLREAQKMESVGRLAGGVAHDFNNILTAVLVSSEIAQESLPPDSEAAVALAEISKAALRARDLTRQLLSFGRRQILRPDVVTARDLVTEVASMLQRVVPESHELEIRNSATRNVRVDRGQAGQVLVNLVVNAVDAMPEGGRITIETSDAELDAEMLRRRPLMKPGSYVQISVSDTGQGMDEATRERIFEPFFTTKGAGVGTGLGLAVVYGIVHQSGGHVFVYSEPGQGSTFKIYLPAVSESAAEPPAPVAEPRVDLMAGTPAPVVLVVEDDRATRRAAAVILEGAGYVVLQAENGEQALSVARDHAGPIHLVLTDVVMPRMSGRSLVERLAVSRPSSRVLYMSGFTDNAIVHHGILDPGTNFLQKPFVSRTLLEAVHRALHS